MAISSKPAALGLNRQSVHVLMLPGKCPSRVSGGDLRPDSIDVRGSDVSALGFQQRFQGGACRGEL